MRRKLAYSVALLTTWKLVSSVSIAEACGCLAPPDPSVPVVQAGERIAFSTKNGEVTAHIQVQYAGKAEEFGWLLPMPSIPSLEVGTDELFTQLIASTQPKYKLNATYVGDCWFDPAKQGFPSSDGAGGGGGSENPETDGGSPLVLRDQVGPYDYAILKADSKTEMLKWLSDNSFFVPVGTEDVVGPYIHPGAYFLAIKLLSGNDAGDIAPVIVKYKSDYPMIPIVLTSVAANPDMGVQVWVLGKHRAIPRNYYHTVINDAELDWAKFGANYVDVVTAAVDEANGHHSFVTEYAGSTSVMANLLDYEGRFGNLDDLRTLTDAIAFVEQMTYTGFTIVDNATFQPFFPARTLSILQGILPVPQKLLEEGVTPNQYYTQMRYYAEYDRASRPEIYQDLDLTFEPGPTVDELNETVVKPAQAASKFVLDNPYMSRLFTTLSPQEMTKDPVFAFNPDLPDVANVHEGSITYFCEGDTTKGPGQTRSKVETESGFVLYFPNGTDSAATEDAGPSSLRIEMLHESGKPVVVTDNAALITKSLSGSDSDSGGCSTSQNTTPTWFLTGLAFATLLWLRRVQRPAQKQ